MKKIFLSFLFLVFVIGLRSQNKYSFLSYAFPSDSLKGFNEVVEKGNALSGGYFGLEYKVYMYRAKRNFINSKYNINQTTGITNKAPIIINSAPCLNEDFEASPVGSVSAVSGWTITEGFNTSTCTMGGCCTVTATGLNTWIRSTPYMAPWPIGTIPNSPLGGTKIIQLNDEIINTGEMVRMEQAFPVTSTNSFFQYAYLCAFDGTEHICCKNPYFNVLFFDCSNNLISSATTSLIAPGPFCTYSVSNWVPPAATTSGIGYQSAWQVKTVDLTPYIGSCIRVQVNVGDCDAWAHPGMCFFDAKCSQLNVNVNGNTVSPSGSLAVCALQATLSAPPGLSPITWYGPIASGVNSNTNSVVTTSISGTYTLTTGTGTNVTANVFSLTLLAPPTASLTVSSPSTCAGGASVTLIGSPSGGTYYGLGVSGNVFTPPGTYGNYTIGYLVTNAINGCTATATQTIFVNAPPLWPTSITGPNNFCSGAVVYSVVPFPLATSYNWTLPSGWLGTSTTNSILAIPNNTPGIVSVSASNICGAGPTVTLGVYVNPTPTLIVSGANPICVGETTTLTATGANNYAWTPGGTGNTTIVSPTVTSTYTATGVNFNGCVGTQVITVTVNPLPVISVAATSSIVCANQTVNINAIGGTNYTWSPTGQNGNSITVTPTTNTTYSVNGMDANGCKGYASLSISVLPLPIVSLIASSYTACTSGGTISLNASPSGGVYYGTGVSGPSFSPPSMAGNYLVSYSYSDPINSCANTATLNITVNVCTAIDGNSLTKSEFKIYPNPNNGEFVIEASNDEVVMITNELGQTIKIFKLNSENNYSTKVSGLAAGIYFVAGNQFREKVVITK